MRWRAAVVLLEFLLDLAPEEISELVRLYPVFLVIRIEDALPGGSDEYWIYLSDHRPVGLQLEL